MVRLYQGNLTITVLPIKNVIRTTVFTYCYYLKPSTFEMVLEYGSLTLAVVLLYLVYYHPLEFHYHVAKGLLSSLYTNSLIERNTIVI